jgi:fructuronate reductase
MKRLDTATIATLPATVARPRYGRRALQPGIVHLGLGAFARAHLAVATEAAIAASGDLRWGLLGVSLRRPDTRDALAAQDGLYVVASCDADPDGKTRMRPAVIGCVTRALVAPENPGAVLDAIADPAARIVSLTVTEKGYHHVPATGALRDADAELEHDLRQAAAPRTALGFIVHGLCRRRAAGLAPLALLSLDNLPANGDTLRGLVLAFAERFDPGLASWIGEQCTFPNSMVDRIVPRTTDVDRDAVARALGCRDAAPVLTEPYFDWAVEDRFAAGRPDWSAGGARFVASAAPFEASKLRMVNGSHSAIAYLGAVAGWRTVDAAIGEPALARFIDAMMRDEIEPTLPRLPGRDLGTYRAAILARFANPALAHRTQQIAMDGSQKLPQRLLGTVRDRLAAGLPITRLGLAVAGWLHYLIRQRDDNGQAYAIDDPLRAELADLARHANAAADPVERAARMIGYRPVFGDLVARTALVDAVARALESLRRQGVRATLEAWR